MRERVAWLVLAISIATPAWAGKLTLEIDGLPDEVERSVRGQLTLAQYLDRDVSAAQVTRLLKQSPAEIQEALEPFGYYHGESTQRLERGADEVRVVFTVVPGEPVRVTRSSVGVSDEAARVPAVARALAAFTPAPGAPLNHGDYEHSKAAIARALNDSGYLAAHLRSHRVEVSRATRSATIDLSWDCGERYRFGPIQFPPVQVTNTLLMRMVPWREGDYYATDQLSELQKRLDDTGYFAVASVEARVREAQNGSVPVDVKLTPALRDAYGGSLYYSTDTGAGINLSFQRRWLNDSGHKLKADGDYAERLQTATVSYGIPFAGPDKRSFNFGVTYKDETTDSAVEQTTKLALNESREWRGYTRTLGVQLVGGDFEIGSEHGNSNELYLEGVLTRTQSDDPVFPLQGYSATVTARVAPANVVSRTRFAAIDMRAKWLQSLDKRSRVIVRGSLGAMTVDDFDELPPELRFFTGGDRSIRGFDYEAIGSKNDAGDVIGGTLRGVLSAEYERYFAKKWGAAVFVDGGDAFLSGDFDWNIGVGLGLRWKSPVGVVRLDVAMPVETELEKSVRVHMTIGPDL
jgi:translocation and assembly module TamA